MDELEGGEPDPTNAIDVLRCFRCRHEGCTNVPSWGYDGEEGPTLCSEHAAPAMTQLVELCCQEPGCNARMTFGFDGAAAQFCPTHKKENMVDLMKRRSQCVVPNCTKLSTYGFDGFLARFCFSHKLRGMVYLKNRKRCEYYECTRQPTYGMDGHQAKFCSSHKEEGMVDVKNCRCKHPGCTRQPNYGHEGGRAKYCSSHKMTDMINVVSRRCEYLDCKRQPIYGFEGEKATLCPQHRLETMVDVVNRHCEFRGCTKTPSYGYEGERAQFCSYHHLPDMKDVKNRRCEWHECRRYPFFGHEGERARFCSMHKHDGMVNVRNRRCAEGDCSRPPTHGYPGGKPQWCIAHARPGMVSLKIRKSIVGEPSVHKYESDVDRHAKGASSGMSGIGQETGSSYGGDPRDKPGMLRGIHMKEATGERLSRPGAYFSVGSRATGSPEDLGHGISQEGMYSGQGAQGQTSATGWRGPGAILREGGSSSGGANEAAARPGVLSQEGSLGSTSYPDDPIKHSRVLGAQADLSRHTPSLQSVEHRFQGRSSGIDPNDQLYTQSPLHQQQAVTAQLPLGHSQSTPQASIPAPGRSPETSFHDVRSLHYGYRHQGQRQRELQAQESRAYSSSSFAGLGAGAGDSETSSGRASGMAGGRATLSLPPSQPSVAQPRARRPRPPSPARGAYAHSEGDLEAALGGGKRGGTSSPFLGHQPSGHLRPSLPPITPVMSASLPSGFQSIDWAGLHSTSGAGGLGGGSGGGGGGRGDARGSAGGGGGGGEGASIWSRDVGLPMGSIGHPYQAGASVNPGEETKEMGIGGGTVRGGTVPSSVPLRMDAAGEANEGGFGTRLTSVDLGSSGGLQPFDRMQEMGTARNSAPGAFPGIAQELSGGGDAAEGRMHFSSTSGYVDDSIAVGGPARPLSPLMSTIGDSGESPPGLPRLRTLDERTQGSQIGASYAAHNLPISSSSAALPPQSLPGLEQRVSSSMFRTGPDQGVRALDALVDQRAGGGPSSGGGRHLGATATLENQGGARLGGGGEGWAPALAPMSASASAGAVGQGRAPIAGDVGHEADEDDPRKRLRVGRLIH